MSSENNATRLETMDAELAALRDRIRLLEKQRNCLSTACRRSDRKDFVVDIEFIGDFDVEKARGVNISESGICFDVLDRLPFEMRFQDGDRTVNRRAYLAWMKHFPDGRQRFGFSFCEEPSDEVL